MRFSNFFFLFVVVLSCSPMKADERNANALKARADSLARADSIATADSSEFASSQRFLYIDDPGTDGHARMAGTGWLELVNDSVRVTGSGNEILMFRFPNGQTLDDARENIAQGYLELSPEQQAVFSSVRFVFTIGGLECADATIPDALGADPDTTYLKTIHNIEFKVSEVGLGGHSRADYTLYQFAYNNVCLSFRMEANEVSNASPDHKFAYKSIRTIFEDFLDRLEMKEVLD